MTVMKKLGFAAPLFMFMMIPCTWAQSDAAHTSQDTRFVMAASAAGQTEILASRMADSHTQSAAIRSFAQTMITDHTKAGDQLMAVAKKDSYNVSSTPTQAQESALSQLKPLKGADFDKAYAAMMVKDHREAVALFQSESASGNNADLKAFATQTLPTLQHHLALANSL